MSSVTRTATLPLAFVVCVLAVADVAAMPAVAVGESSGAAAPQDPSDVEASLALDRSTRRLIQQRLRNEGFDPGTPDGLFGPRTRAAIREWQQSRGTSPAGYLTGAQAEVLRTATAPPPATSATPPPPKALPASAAIASSLAAPLASTPQAESDPPRAPVAAEAAVAEAARCRTWISYQNTDRSVPGHVAVECGRGTERAHSAPFGNWGVKSPHGGYRDGYQFTGWEPDDGWLQWNSCTTIHAFQTERFLPGGRPQYADPSYPINTYVTTQRRGGNNIPCDQVYRSGLYIAVGLYMRLYELDTRWDLFALGNGSDHVDTLRYPPIRVPITCYNERYCRGESSWTPASRSGGIVRSQIRIVLYTRYY